MVELLPPDGVNELGGRMKEILLFLDSSAGDLARRLKLYMSGDAASLGDAVKEAAELRKWAQLAYEERNRIDKLVRDNAGGEPEHAIDFSEARAQIGRRLDRLRAARDSGEVSG